MRSFLLRLGDSLLLLWLVLSLTFLLVRAAPGDAAALLVDPSATAAESGRLRRELGLDAPLAVQYARWAGGVLTGDLGRSFASGRPVTAVLGDALPASLALGAVSLALTFLLGAAVGTLQGARLGTRLDRVLGVVTTAVYAAPGFWLALAAVALVTYGAARLGLPAWMRLPAFGARDPGATLTGMASLVDVVRHAILPVLVLTAVGAAGIARYARSAVADVIGEDWVRTARAKGLGPRGVYLHHVLRNVLPPLVVLFALALPGVVAGSVLIESVFAWPGMGRVTLSAIAARDYPVVLGAAAMYAALVIGGNFAADVALLLLDPRRRRAA